MPDFVADYWVATTGCALFDTSARGKLEVAGPDAPRFLHNLCTNDTLTLAVGAGCEAFFTDPRAKAVGAALIYHVRPAGRDVLWLDTPPGLAAPLLAHLDKHLISEQVELADRTAEFAQFHLAGPRAASVLAIALDEDIPPLGPLEHMERTFGAKGTAHIRRHDPLGVPGFDLVCLTERAEMVRNALTHAGAKPAGAEAYEVLRIEAGTPVFGAEFDHNRFVAEVGRPWAISFNKGCYLGQEPLVMARDRAGHVNRLLRGLRIEGADTVPIGAKLWRADAEVGVVTSATLSPEFGSIALAYLKHRHQEPGTAVEVETPTGRRAATVVELPLRRSKER